MRLGLHETIRATCHGIEISVPNFYAIFELYCPALGTFFTPVDDLRLALHEIWEISNLSMGSMPYDEYFPCTMELQQMVDNSKMFETYRELVCHFYICRMSTMLERIRTGRRFWWITYFPFWTMPLRTFNSRYQKLISTE